MRLIECIKCAHGEAWLHRKYEKWLRFNVEILLNLENLNRAQAYFLYGDRRLLDGGRFVRKWSELFAKLPGIMIERTMVDRKSHSSQFIWGVSPRSSVIICIRRKMRNRKQLGDTRPPQRCIVPSWDSCKSVYETIISLLGKSDRTVFIPHKSRTSQRCILKRVDLFDRLTKR